MKRLLLTLILALTLSSACADDGTTVLDLSWDSPYALKVPNSEITHPADSPAVMTISIIPTSLDRFEAYQSLLFRIPNPPIKSRTYALTGEVAYQHLASAFEVRNYLSLISSYLETGVSICKTDADAGLQGYFSGTSDFRPFAVTYHWGTGTPGKLLQLEIGVNIASRLRASENQKIGDVAGTLSLRNLKLVEYPDPSPPPTPPAPTVETAAPAPPASFSGLHWPSFWIGVTTCVLTLLALAQVLVLVRRAKQARKDKEMRRIASLDR